jgi:HPt (histidine-containing phosphotransfer) domain-containing protein
VKNTPIDLVHLSRQTAGDRDLERELLAVFADQCVRQLQTIRDAADPALRRDAAHTLKGAALAIGAWGVADAAEAIETGVPSPRDEDIAVLKRHSDQARQAIADWLSAA